MSFTPDDILRAAFAAIRESLVVIDEAAVVRHANPAFFRTFGQTEADVVGRPIRSLCGGTWDCPLINKLLEILDRQDSVTDYRVEHGFPDPKILVVHGYRLPGMGLRLLAIEDITKVESERAEYLERLSRKRTELEQAADRSAREVAARDQFLSVLSHELRNPLGTMTTALQVLQRAAGAQLPPNAQRAVDSMHRQADHMRRLIDDLLDVARLTHGKIVLQKKMCDLREVLKEATEQQQQNFTVKGQVFEYTGPEHIRFLGDPTRLQQVFSNLLNNASKFTPEGGRVAVRVSMSDMAVTVAISDTGVGVDPQNIPQLFAMFYQEDRVFRDSSGGLGLGLHLCRSLVTLHGGKIEVQSPGKQRGTTVVVTLPHPPKEDEFPRKLRVMVVDDNRDGADQMAELLGLNDFDVRTAYNGEQALDVIPQFRPDVILLDLGMPGLSGYDVARRLGDARPPIIALTGMGTDVDRQRSMAAGFAEHLVKPVKENEVLRVINAVLLPRK